MIGANPQSPIPIKKEYKYIAFYLFINIKLKTLIYLFNF